MNKFAIALAAVVSLGLAVPAFAEKKMIRKCRPGKCTAGRWECTTTRGWVITITTIT